MNDKLSEEEIYYNTELHKRELSTEDKFYYLNMAIFDIITELKNNDIEIKSKNWLMYNSCIPRCIEGKFRSYLIKLQINGIVPTFKEVKDTYIGIISEKISDFTICEILEAYIQEGHFKIIKQIELPPNPSTDLDDL